MKQIIFIFSVLWLSASATAWAASKANDVKSGNKAYLKGDYVAAAQRYEKALQKDSESDVINFNLGTAYYKQKQYDRAIQYLQKGLLSDDTKFRQRTAYNLGDAFYQQGLTQETKDLQKAIASLEQSLKHFETAVKLNDTDADAKYNYEVVKKELARLQKKQQQSKQQQKQSQKQQQAQDKKEQPSQQSQENSSQGKEDKDSAKNEQQQNTNDQQPSDEKQQQQENSAQNEDPSASEQKNAKAMTDQETEMMLRNYQQSEEPKGLLNFMNKTRPEAPVSKDW